MKSSEICSLAINIVAWNYGEVEYRKDNTLYYPDASWNLLTWKDDNAWHADCLGFVRAVLCGWHADKNAVAGGANTGFNCYSFTEDMFLASCSSTSTDFSQLNTPCSLLYKNGHVGLYVGEFQLDGFTYNLCEVTTSWGWGGRPSWVEPDGCRKQHKDAGRTDSYWTNWGLFNLDGNDYGITEYDGGAIGATGFGSELSQTEVDYYWDTLSNLTYDYVESIAESIHGMSADVFAVMAGWGWGEGYSVARPVGASEPDIYMGYLCDCIPVNYYEGLGITTGQAMASRIQGGGGSYYSYESMIARAQNLKTNESTWNGQQELKALLLALLNPDQRAYYCNGYPNPTPTYGTPTIIYQNEYSGEGMIYVFYYNVEAVAYDITGSGIRGGNIDPSGSSINKIPLWMYLKPYQHYSNYYLNYF